MTALKTLVANNWDVVLGGAGIGGLLGLMVWSAVRWSLPLFR